MRNIYIDVGSTNIKYACYENGIRKGQGKAKFPLPVKNDGFCFEVPANEIIAVLQECIDSFANAENVVLSVQMHGYVLSQRENVYVSWRDKRCLRENRYEALKQTYGKYITAHSGTASKPNLAVYSLLYEEMNGAAVRGELFSLGSYINYRLTGNNCSHSTDLCALGFYHRDGKPNEALISALPFRLRLPYCGKDGESGGDYKGKKVYMPIGDHQCSVLSVGKSDATVLNIGTAAQISRVVRGFSAGDYESRPYFEGDTLCTQTGLVGGAEMNAQKFSCALEERIRGQYRDALEKLHAGKKVYCMGGAFDFYGETIQTLLMEEGYSPFLCRSDSLSGLNVYFRKYICQN